MGLIQSDGCKSDSTRKHLVVGNGGCQL